MFNGSLSICGITVLHMLMTRRLKTVATNFPLMSPSNSIETYVVFFDIVSHPESCAILVVAAGLAAVGMPSKASCSRKPSSPLSYSKSFGSPNEILPYLASVTAAICYDFLRVKVKVSSTKYYVSCSAQRRKAQQLRSIPPTIGYQYLAIKFFKIEGSQRLSTDFQSDHLAAHSWLYHWIHAYYVGGRI